MTDFDAIPFLAIGAQTISLGQALRYLKRSGKLTAFLNEIVGQHVLLLELASRQNLDISIAELEQQVQSFRERQQLDNPDSFQEWLSSNGLTYGAFHNLVTDDLKVEKLKAQISEEPTSTYFNEHQDALTQVKLTYIVFTEQALADEVRQRIDQGKASFDDVASECLNQAFLKHSNQVALKQETLRRGQIRQELQSAIADMPVGQAVGPVGVDGQWWLLKVDEILEAKLEGALKQQLETDFFKRWLTERMQQAPVQLAGNAL